MGSAIGGSGPSPSGGGGPPDLGALDVWVTDHGAVADGSTDNTAAFQAAHDAAAALVAAGATAANVRVPSAPLPYVVAGTVYADSSGVWFEGEGPGSHVQQAGGSCVPAFAFGLPRDQGYYSGETWVPQTVTSAYRPDLYGVLDASAVTAAGQMWGVRTNGVAVVQYQGGPLSSGVRSGLASSCSDNWGETSELTVEVCFAPGSGTIPLNTPLLGLGYVPDDPAPFTLSTWNAAGLYLVCFKTADIDPTVLSYRSFGFSLTGFSAPYRLAFQLDLGGASVSAFCNGTQLAIVDTGNLTSGSPVPFLPGAKFAVNDHYPFFLGYSGINPPYAAQSVPDVCFYGLRLSNALRYENRGTGQAQTRADAPSTPVNDSWAYFGDDANTVCFLAGTDNPATPKRSVTFTAGGAACFAAATAGFFQHVNHQPVNRIWNGMRDMAIDGNQSYGQVVLLCAVYDFEMERCRVLGGFHSVGNFNFGSNYYVRLKDCVLRGFDACLYAYASILDVDTLECRSTGRVPLRFCGSAPAIRDVFVSGYDAVCEAVFKARTQESGGDHSLEKIRVDFEGATFSLAAFYCEADASTPQTSLSLKDVFLGTVGSAAALVMVRDTSASDAVAAPSFLRVENLKAYTGQYEAAVVVDGPKWYGTVEASLLAGTRVRSLGTFGPQCNVVVREYQFTAPPRDGYWYRGGHALLVPYAADGQYSEWRCVATGQYGTSSPPKWAGTGRAGSAQGALAGYVDNHRYFAPVTLTP